MCLKSDYLKKTAMSLTSRGKQLPFPQTQADCITSVNAYQQALEDFGVLELCDRLTHLSQATPLSKGELDSLTALLICQLANSLNQQQVSDFIKAIQLDNSVSGLPSLSFNTSVSSVSLPPNFPESAQTPKFLYGDRVKWKPLSETDNTDTGVIIGRFYAFAHHRHQWSWKYLIFLDTDSYSRCFCSADAAWEQDLEPLD
jgi:hypothetical protein